MYCPSVKNTNVLESFFSKSLLTPIKIAIVKPELEQAVNDSDLSRFALWRLLKPNRQGCRSNSKNMKFPQRCFSVSHAGRQGFAATTSASHVKGIGIDFEPYRCVSTNALSLYTNQIERHRLAKYTKDIYEPIRIWTTKESIYKSDHNNRKYGWLSVYTLNRAEQWVGKARLAVSPYCYYFRYASTHFSNGILSVAIQYKRT